MEQTEKSLKPFAVDNKYDYAAIINVNDVTISIIANRTWNNIPFLCAQITTPKYDKIKVYDYSEKGFYEACRWLDWERVYYAWYATYTPVM